MKIIQYLFRRGFLPYNPSKLNLKRSKKIIESPKYNEFREVFLDEICKKMAENLDLLRMPVKNLEQKGELNAVTRIYEDMIELFTPEIKDQRQGYIDPIMKIKENIKKEFEKK